jgi:lipid A 3-O-deacylase
MVRREFKITLIIAATAILLAGLLPHDAQATGMYDMRGFLGQGHPFDTTDPRNRAPAPTPYPVQAQPVVTTPASPAYRQPVAPPTVPRKANRSALRKADPTGLDRPPTNQRAEARSGNNNDAPLLGFISEFRVGGLAHDQGPFSHNKEDGYDINAEILFASPGFLDLIWSPRPHIGATRNSIGRTSQVYAGITWDWSFWNGFFAEFAWGAAGHNGNKVKEDPDFKDLGCHLLFREGLDFGYRLAGHGLSLHLAHISNAKLCDKNEGLETVGLRYGYRF